ncbi:MAG: VCBS repeat-containing protein, partial [Candidatus Limnocylindrales bacterium]
DGKLDLVQLSPTALRVSILKKGKYRKLYQRKLTHGRAIAAGDANGDGRGDLYIVRSNAARNYPDVMLLNRKAGASWSSVTIPQASGGSGDGVYAIDHDGNGLDDFLVLNGHNRRGPTQLIAFYPR